MEYSGTVVTCHMGYSGTMVTCYMEYSGAGSAFDVLWNKAIIKILLRISLPINYNIIHTALFHIYS